jgi:hypothetical protein
VGGAPGTLDPMYMLSRPISSPVFKGFELGTNFDASLNDLTHMGESEIIRENCDLQNREFPGGMYN